jgi:hypothetical protein
MTKREMISADVRKVIVSNLAAALAEAWRCRQDCTSDKDDESPAAGQRTRAQMRAGGRAPNDYIRSR